MERYEKELLKYGKIAYISGKKLICYIVKREGFRNWRIALEDTVEHGEDRYNEED